MSEHTKVLSAEGGVGKACSIGMTVETATPSDACNIVSERMRGIRCVLPIDRMLQWNTWTAEQAAWLALGIDPAMTDPVWSVPRPESSLRASAAIVIRDLEGAVGRSGTPDAYIERLRVIGIDAEWMHRDGPKAQRERAILDCLAREGIDPLKKKPRGTKQKISFMLLDERPDLFNRTSISEGGSFNEAWQSLRSQRKILDGV